MSDPKSPNTASAEDRTAECKVCGKLFPRGKLDLLRHTTAVTLKHGFSEKKTSSFTFGCKKCGTYFSSKEHLSMHAERSSCNPAVFKEREEADEQDNEDETEDDEDDKASTTKSKGQGSVASDSETTKLTECLVCGKTFPRGILDLQRHVNAITLQVCSFHHHIILSGRIS
jgi:hypothetical protein